MGRITNAAAGWKRDFGWKGTLVFLYLWLMVGFAAGTLVLVGPVRWLTEGVRAQEWGQGVEDVLMMGVIGAYVVLSFFLAVYVTRLLLTYRARAFKTGVVAGVTLAALVALWGWSNPAVYAAVGGGGTSEYAVAMESGAHFIFGAYPDRERLEELQSQGVAAVVSLQHPAVVPFERQGIASEKEAAADLGVEFIHAPMLPWVSDNAASLQIIGRLAETGQGTYYVHCGLGRDRVNVVRQMLEGMGGDVRLAAGEVERKALTWGDREAEGLGIMERGAPLEIAPTVWVVPYPNGSEFFGHLLAGQVAHVLLVLDEEDVEQKRWLEEARERFDTYAVSYTHRPLDPGDAEAARALALEARSLPRPLTVIVPSTRLEGDVAVADAFREAWKAVGSRRGPPVRAGAG